jgi:hypothetical protein
VNFLDTWLTALPILGKIAILAAILIALFVWWTRANEPLWFDFLVNFPMTLFGHIGELKRLKRNTTNLNDQRNWRYGISAQERALCDAYRSKLNDIVSKERFENAAEYLGVTGQSSVRPMRPWMWVLLAILTVGEAAGTGKLLGEYVSTTVTANQVEFYTWGFAIFLAIVLLGLTHAAGREQAVHATYRKILGNLDPEAEPEGYKRGADRAFESNQFIDRGDPQPVRFFARLERKKDRGGNKATIGVVVGLLIVFVCVFAGRWYGIRQQNTRQVTQMEHSGVGTASGAGGSDPFASATAPDNEEAATQPELPDVQQARQASRKTVADTIGKEMLGQGFAMAVLLAMLYVLVQGLGFFFSYDHSFFENGAKAYSMIRGEPSYEAYLNHYFWPFANLAEARLSSLRAHYARGNEGYSHAMPTMTFGEYFELRKQSSLTTTAANPTAPAATPAAAAAPPPPNVRSIAELAASIQSQSSKEARLARMQAVRAQLGGDPVLEGELKNELARLKEERARLKMTQDMSDLLED